MECLLIVFVLLTTAGFNAAPAFLNSFTNGIPSEAVAVRTGEAAELYGLKIKQMILPSPIHRFSPFSRISDYYNSNALLVNENATASLGLIGSLGFIYSPFLFLMQKKEDTIDTRLGVINGFGVFLATIGGFGSAISFIFLPSIRG